MVLLGIIGSLQVLFHLIWILALSAPGFVGVYWFFFNFLLYSTLFRHFIERLEDRSAQAPLILAPAEGFRGPSAPFGGLRPRLEAFGLFFGAFGPFLRPMASPNTTNEFLSSSICFLIPNMLKLAQKWLKLSKLHENCVKLREHAREIFGKYYQ